MATADFRLCPLSLSPPAPPHAPLAKERAGLLHSSRPLRPNTTLLDRRRVATDRRRGLGGGASAQEDRERRGGCCCCCCCCCPLASPRPRCLFPPLSRQIRSTVPLRQLARAPSAPPGRTIGDSRGGRPMMEERHRERPPARRAVRWVFVASRLSARVCISRTSRSVSGTFGETTRVWKRGRGRGEGRGVEGEEAEGRGG